MQIFRFLTIVLVLFLSSSMISAQELRCNFEIYHEKIQGNHTQLFNNMEKSIQQFLNTQQWTNYNFSPHHRIECNFLLVINSKADDSYSAELQVQASRPVYQSSYRSNLFNYKDTKVHFTYKEFEPLYHDQAGRSSALVSILAYYANLIVGLHQDSFNPLGGTMAFQYADRIANNAEGQLYAGWESSDIRGRYWIAQMFLQEFFAPLRTFSYKYHREGLDVMADDVAKGSQVISDHLYLLEEVESNRSGSVPMQLFFDAKSSELISIYSGASREEKQQAYDVLKRLDPARKSKYQAIIK